MRRLHDFFQRRPRLDAAVLALSRGGVAAILVLLTAVSVQRAAFALDDPDEDIPAAVREALDSAYEGEPDGQLDFNNVAGGKWHRLHVFPPLSKSITIERRLEEYEDHARLPEQGTSGDEALLVFVDDRRVLGTALVHRREIDIACIVASRRWVPRVAVVSPSRPLRVIRTERRQPPLLAVTANDRRGVRHCLRRLPDLNQADG